MDAREIAAGLSAQERETLRIMHGGAIWLGAGHRERLFGLGLISVGPPQEVWHEGDFRLTDLGRQVSKVLGE